MLRFNIIRKSYRCLAACFCSFLINVKEIVAFMPFQTCTLLFFWISYSLFLSMFYYLQLQPTVCSPTLVFLADSSARLFCFITSEYFGCQYKHSLSRMIIYYSDK